MDDCRSCGRQSLRGYDDQVCLQSTKELMTIQWTDFDNAAPASGADTAVDLFMTTCTEMYWIIVWDPNSAFCHVSCTSVDKTKVRQVCCCVMARRINGEFRGNAYASVLDSCICC